MQIQTVYRMFSENHLYVSACVEGNTAMDVDSGEMCVIHRHSDNDSVGTLMMCVDDVKYSSWYGFR